MASISAPTYAKTADIVIEGRIGNNMKQASETLSALASKQKTINVVIDSPGGSVYAGWYFISTIQQAQASGVVIDCYVSGMAASMAFQILSFCDGKYSLPYAMLLWHPVRAGGRAFTPNEAHILARSLREMEGQLIKELRQNFTFANNFFRFHYRAETLHVGISLEKRIPELKLTKKVPASGDKTVVAKDAGFSFQRRLLDYAHPAAIEIYNGRGN